jgi:uncharacterized protein YjdB
MKNLAINVAPALVALAFAACSGDDAATVVVNDVMLNSQTMSVAKDDTGYLHAIISPSGATDKAVTWESSSSAVVVIANSAEQTAELFGVEEGTATITVTTRDGKKTDSCTVKVVDPGVVLNRSELPLVLGASDTLVATVEPEEAAAKGVTWSTSNNKVALVNTRGYVSAVGTGKATITATTNLGGKRATCSVNVTEPAF